MPPSPSGTDATGLWIDLSAHLHESGKLGISVCGTVQYWIIIFRLSPASTASLSLRRACSIERVCESDTCTCSPSNRMDGKAEREEASRERPNRRCAGQPHTRIQSRGDDGNDIHCASHPCFWQASIQRQTRRCDAMPCDPMPCHARPQLQDATSE